MPGKRRHCHTCCKVGGGKEYARNMGRSMEDVE
jgi:hypothetical protein